MSKNSLSLLYLLSTTIITHACLPLTQPFDHVGGSGDGDDDDDDDVYAHMQKKNLLQTKIRYEFVNDICNTKRHTHTAEYFYFYYMDGSDWCDVDMMELCVDFSYLEKRFL